MEFSEKFEAILAIIKRPNTYFMADVLGIRKDTVRHRFVASRRGKGAPGSNSKEPFSEEELIDTAIQGLQNKIGQLESMRSPEPELKATGNGLE